MWNNYRIVLLAKDHEWMTCGRCVLLQCNLIPLVERDLVLVDCFLINLSACSIDCSTNNVRPLSRSLPPKNKAHKRFMVLVVNFIFHSTMALTYASIVPINKLSICDAVGAWPFSQPNSLHFAKHSERRWDEWQNGINCEKKTYVFHAVNLNDVENWILH